MQAWLACFRSEVEGEKNPAEEGQPVGSATEDGASQVSSPVTATDWQGKSVDEDMDAVLGMDAGRQVVQSPISNERGRSSSLITGCFLYDPIVG